MADLVVWGTVSHLVADWLFQNRWMAQNKNNLLHPAAWVHGVIHVAAQLIVFPEWWMAVLIGAVHMLIDTRVFLRWWFKTFGFTTEGPVAIHVAIWADQVLHILTIALVARFLVK